MAVNTLGPAFAVAGVAGGLGAAQAGEGTTVVLCSLNGIRVVHLDADGAPAAPDNKVGEECLGCLMGVAGLSSPDIQPQIFGRPAASPRPALPRRAEFGAAAPETQPASPRAPPSFV